MGLRIDNAFVLPMPLDAAWRTVIDLPRVVPCMPGTELLEVMEGGRFRARARLKVGPVELVFAGEGELYDVASAAHAAKLRARGNDTKGRGGFQTIMTLALAAQGNETQVHIDTDLTLSGSIAQYGRGAGVVKDVARALTEQFSRNLAQLGAVPAASGGSSPTPPPATPISGFALLLATLRNMLRRWFGRTPR